MKNYKDLEPEYRDKCIGRDSCDDCPRFMDDCSGTHKKVKQ